MNYNIDLLSIIKNATESDTAKIAEGEKILNQLKVQNFPSLLLNLSEILANEGVELKLRQLTSTLIKNFVAFNIEDSITWLNMDLTIKNEIKSNILSCLASENNLIRKGASNVIAGKNKF